jgi:hypothetical protein
MKKDIFNGVAASFATGAAMGLRGMALILLQLLCTACSATKNTFINVRNMC